MSAQQSGNGAERAENGESGSVAASGHSSKRLNGSGAWRGRPQRPEPGPFDPSLKLEANPPKGVSRPEGSDEAGRADVEAQRADSMCAVLGEGRKPLPISLGFRESSGGPSGVWDGAAAGIEFGAF